MLTPDRSHLDYRALLRKRRRLDPSAATRTLRLAILSDADVQHLVPLLEVLLAERGIRADIHRAEYDAIELQIVDPRSALYAFDPEVVVLLHSGNALRAKYYRHEGDRGAFLRARAEHLASLWDRIGERCAATIVQSTLALPYERHFGNYEHKVDDAFGPGVARLNAEIAALARTRRQVLINDVEAIAAYVGRRHWMDEKLWTLAKAFCALDHLPLVAQNIADIVLANQGHLVKCVVTDLDNTLWGGVIGDDGVEGILIGPHGDGEPFFRLQHFLRELTRRGIVLAVCSKNDEANALEPFRSHPEMVLRESDIAVFVANWEPKPDNIRHIRETLNIGFDAIVFLDDNPFERDLVRRTLPEVVVPELPEDPADYVRSLCELNLFETTSFSEEDRRRADLYRENASRRQLEERCTDLDEYLRSLDMQITTRRFDAFGLPRVAQLIQRSNQFNLTTRRYSAAECGALAEDASVTPLYFSLADRFGDNGIISVVILRAAADALEIDSWIMSCRVLGRGVEQYVMNRVVAHARAQGLGVVRGTYRPTAKNGMVREFYRQFGFVPVGETADGGTRWELAVDAYAPRPVHMKEAA